MTDCLRRGEIPPADAAPPNPTIAEPGRTGSDRNGLPTFVLSGGGNLGALQVGMMYALVESGLAPGMIVGTSVGAINGAFLASRLDLPGITEIARLWSSLRRRDVIGVDFGTIIGGIRGRPRHLFDSSSIRRILESFLTFHRLEDAPVPLTVVATELHTGEAVVLNSGDATTALLASSAVPRLLPPVEIDGRILVDGAFAADIPIRQALSLGAREVYVLPTAPTQVAAWVREAADCVAREGADRPIVRVVPPPELHIPMARLDQSKNLLKLGYDQTKAWLEGRTLSGAPLPDRGPAPRFAYRPPVDALGQSS
jgi:predicted acylesterase/phospholipase RssA